MVKYINQGKSFDEIVKYAEELKWMIRHELTVDDLFHLKRGGRIGVVSAIFGSMLSIKPIINVNDEGKLIPFSKIRGRNSSIRALQEYFIKYNDITEDDPIFISHSNCYEEACKLKAMIQEIKPNNKSWKSLNLLYIYNAASKLKSDSFKFPLTAPGSLPPCPASTTIL